MNKDKTTCQIMTLDETLDLNVISFRDAYEKMKETFDNGNSDTYAAWVDRVSSYLESHTDYLSCQCADIATDLLNEMFDIHPDDIKDEPYNNVNMPDNDSYMINSIEKKFHIKDSGERTEFSTGAVRDMHSGKGRFDLLPLEAVWDLAKHCEAGAKKYGEHNIDKGIPQHSLIDSAYRHLGEYVLGYTDEEHLRAACWNLMWALNQTYTHPELDDIHGEWTLITDSVNKKRQFEKIAEEAGATVKRVYPTMEVADPPKKEKE